MSVKSQEIEKLEYFIKYGNKAPSSHNAKMWKIDIDSANSKIFISLKKESLLPEVDPKNREAWISIGAFTQNIIFIASDYGYNATAVLNDNIVSISFNKTSRQGIDYEPLLKKRRTTREAFNKSKIDDKVLDITERYKDIIYISREDKSFKKIVELSRQANEQQINNFNKREELANWINFKDQKPTGLTLRKLGMNGFERFIFKNFIGKSGFTNSKIIRNGTIKKTNKLYDKCAGYILVITNENNENNWFNAGILLQKIWIELTRKNIKVHPMSQIIEEEPYYSIFKKEINLNNEIQMVLRIGTMKE